MSCPFSSKTVQRIWEDTINFVLWLNRSAWLTVIRGIFLIVVLCVCVYIYLCALHTSGMHTYTWVCLEVQLCPSKLKSWRPCLALDKIRLMPVGLVSFLACIDLSNLFLYFHSGSAGNCVLKGAFLHFTVFIKCAGWELAVGHWSWFYFRGDKAVLGVSASRIGTVWCGIWVL